METALRGLICSFRAENGFGFLELEDGREVGFDVTACVEQPLEGQAVRVVLGESRSGSPRAVLVEPENLPSSTRPPRSLAEAVRRLQTEGLALELDGYEITLAAREGVAVELPEHLPRVLAHYYRHEFFGARRRQADRYAAWHSGQDTAAFARGLADLLAGEAAQFHARELDVHGVDAVVDAFNEELRAQGDARRILPLEGTEGELAYYCMALSRAVRLSSLGVLRVRWDRPHLTPSQPPPRDA
jgi:cold shock CspA family protein